MTVGFDARNRGNLWLLRSLSCCSSSELDSELSAVAASMMDSALTALKKAAKAKSASVNTWHFILDIKGYGSAGL
jgi:hypothetical protein